MGLSGIIQASHACLNQLVGVRLRGQLVESLQKSFSDQRSGSGVMPSISEMDFVEDFNTFLLGNTLKVYTSGASFVELSIDYGIALCSTYYLPSFDLVVGQSSMFEKFHERFCPSQRNLCHHVDERFISIRVVDVGPLHGGYRTSLY